MKTPLNLRHVAKASVRLYFIPLIGAFKGIRSELRRSKREIARHHMSAAESINGYLRQAIKDSVRLYFAPLTGTLRGIRIEVRRANRTAQRDRVKARQGAS